MVIGLTGPTGSGKSEISKHLEKRGFFIVDSDKIVSNIYTSSNECVSVLEKNFEGVVENNIVNKKKLAAIVFKNSKLLLKLSKLVNPYILSEIKNKIYNENSSKIILDAPTLFESNAYKLCDHSMAILSKKNIRLERILARDNITRQDAICRINSQPKDSFYIKRADEIIFNNNSLLYCVKKVENILSKWL